MKKMLALLATIGLVGSLTALLQPESTAQTGDGTTCNGSTNCQAVGCAFVLGSNPPKWRDSTVHNHQKCVVGSGWCDNAGQDYCTTNREWTGGSGCNGSHTDTNGQLVAICGV